MKPLAKGISGPLELVAGCCYGVAGANPVGMKSAFILHDHARRIISGEMHKMAGSRSSSGDSDTRQPAVADYANEMQMPVRRWRHAQRPV